MPATIPVSQVVEINPAVVGAGSNPLSMSGVFVSDNATVPVGSLLEFPSVDAVTDYFGVDSKESKLAQVYFLGFENSTKKPVNLIFAPFATAARAAFARGRSLAGVTLAQIKLINGSLTVTIDGTEKTASSLNLSAASSFTDAASKIGTDLGLASGAACTWNEKTSRFVITSGTTGAQSTISQVTGTASEQLGLSASVLSQGCAQDTSASAMERIKGLSNNWATFAPVFTTTIEQKTAFAEWSNAQNQRYLYVAFDADPNALVSGNKTCFGALAKAAEYNGVMCVYNTPEIAAFVLGATASIDWGALNGRITLAFKRQAGLATTVNNLADATNLLANGYSYYGAYSASGNNSYNFFYDGNVPGKWLWADTYINQIFLNSQLQVAMVDMLLGVNSMPYNEDGYTLVRAAAGDPIQQGLNNGTIRKAVPLSQSQKAQIQTAIGKDVSNELYNNGYYLQILPATAQTRGKRQSPPINFYYMDGGSIQKISIASFAVI